MPKIQPATKRQIANALHNIEHYQTITENDFSAERLGGLTNLVYQVETITEKLIVRIPGEGTAEFINRKVELHNSLAAQKADISAQVIWADPLTGMMISHFIDHALTLSPQLLNTHKDTLERVAKCLKTLHQSGADFQFEFNFFNTIDDYCAILVDKGQKLPSGFAQILAACDPIKQKLQDAKIELTPCHCDPLCENFLDDGSRVWLVDWEYSGMGDPMWDLGDLSVEAEFAPPQEALFLKAYFGRTPTESELGRVVIYKAMCDLMWALWGLIQHANGADAEDYYAYSLARFERCKKLMQNSKFQTHLRAI